jgi:hypothetical protein
MLIIKERYIKNFFKIGKLAYNSLRLVKQLAVISLKWTFKVGAKPASR